MGRTKTPKRPAGDANGTLVAEQEVMTLEQAAAFLQSSEADVLRAVREQGLPGRRIADAWRFSRTALLNWFSIPEPTPLPGKEALLAIAGKYKDDPDLLRICEEAYQRRREDAEGR